MPSIDSPVPVTPEAGITEAHVWAAIADVLDPELDEPLVKLGFVDKVQVENADVTVTFKLPTYWCSPNFAYLMAGDLRDKVRALPGVQQVRVVLLDHSNEDEVTNGINQDKSFAEAFACDEVGNEDISLEELRLIFLRKGFLTRQDALLRQLVKAKLAEETIVALRLADLHVDEEADRAIVSTPEGVVNLERAGHNATAYVRKANRLNLLQQESDLLITDEHGQPLVPGGLQAYLRNTRSVRLNITFNTAWCTGLFRTRYGLKEEGE